MTWVTRERPESDRLAAKGTTRYADTAGSGSQKQE
jgi:hypothetical protein